MQNDITIGAGAAHPDASGAGVLTGSAVGTSAVTGIAISGGSVAVGDQNNAEQASTSPAPAGVDQNVTRIVLDTPLVRGGQTFKAIDLRKPKAGELRGVSLIELLQMDVQSLTKVLPRITNPALTEAELRNLEPSDLVQFGMAIDLFLAPKSARQE